MTDVETSVLIIGAGPVGLGMALDLAWRGIDCVVIEQSDGRTLLPRASGISVRSMEFCRRWGIANEVLHGGFPLQYRLDTIYCTSITGYELERHLNPSISEQRPLAFSPENKHRLPQDMFDPVLERAARRYKEVDIRRRCRLVGFEEVEDGVLGYVQHLQGAQTYSFERAAAPLHRSRTALSSTDGFTVRARYMVGCDGVNSGVRGALGIGTKGTGPIGKSVLGYSISALVRIPTLTRYHTKGEAERFIFVGTDGIWGNLTTVDGRDRWRLTLAGTTELLDLSSIDMPAYMRRGLGRDDIPFEIQVVTPWRRRQMVAERLSLGRVFLAGDAVHAMSPTGGFGMNTGLGDVVDLGWKLEAALRKWAGPGLLDSYQLERGPVAWRNTGAAANNFGSWRLQLDYTRIHEATPEGADERERIGAAIKQAFIGEWESWGAALGYRYDNSPICIPDGTPAPPDDLVAYAPTTRPGARAPHAWLDDERSVLDLFGRGFTLLQFGAGRSAANKWQAAADRMGIPLSTIDLDQPFIANLYEKRYVLVRPDGHVAWRSNAVPQDIGSVLNRVRGGAWTT